MQLVQFGKVTMPTAFGARAVRVTLGLSLAMGSFAARAEPRTLQDALAAAYSTNPTLLSARAQLRATDEGVSQALAGWRPTVVLSGGPGYGDGSNRSASAAGTFYSRNNRDILTQQATLTQPLYAGGGTQANTRAADNRVFAQRGRLMATEQQVITDTVNAFVNVIQSQQTLQLNLNNELVLTRQLEATRERFRIGEITLTDVAQAEAALSSARYTRQSAEANLATSRVTYRRQVGELPDQLVEPQPLLLPVHSEAEASQLASVNNPGVIAALFDDAAARDSIDVAFAALLPQVSLQVQGGRTDNASGPGQRGIAGQVVLNASVPIYQGGAEYSRVRQARQTAQQTRQTVADVRRQSILQAAQSWEMLVANRQQIESTRSQIRANQVALEGTQREAILGSRTTLDVLNAQQLLLNSRVTLIQNLASLVTASYAVASAVGRLTARDLKLGVPLYDETAYYNAVRQRLVGIGDYATNQPSR